MYTNEFPEETLRINFEHWLCEAIRTGVRNAHLQPLTPLTTHTWQAIDEVADAAAAVGGQSAHVARLQDVVLAAREQFSRQLDATQHTSQMLLGRAAS
jgi:hypothetical protein